MSGVAFDQANPKDGQNHGEKFLGDIPFESTPRCMVKAQHVFRKETLLKGVLVKQTFIKIILGMSNKGFCNKVGYQILIIINPATI